MTELLPAPHIRRRRHGILRRLPTAFAVVVLATTAAASDTGSSLPTHPQLQVKTLDGTTFDLQERRGRWVVVNYWATWCAPCLKELPDLSAFDSARDDVEVVGLAFEEIEVDAMRAFLERHPVSYPIAVIDVYQPPADFSVPRGLPMTYLIDPQGAVAKRFLGPVTSSDLAAVIDARPAQGSGDGQ